MVTSFKKLFLSLFILLACLFELSCATTATPLVLHEASSSIKEPTIRVLVSRRRGRSRIRTIKMEKYLAGVIGNEMSRRWPKEALKAQTVAARSYAYYRMKEARANGRRWDVIAGQGDQVFRSRDTGNSYLNSIVAQTRGQFLSDKGRVVQAFYSSTCGGRTRTAKDAGLSNNSPLNRSQSDPYCRQTPFRDWVVKTSLSDLSKRFKKKGIKAQNLKSIRVKSKDRSGFVKSLTYRDDRGQWTMSGGLFRSIMGSYRVKSQRFRIKESRGYLYIHGHGFGHGVGLCQYGAKVMADKRKSYRHILGKYYPGVKLKRLY